VAKAKKKRTTSRNERLVHAIAAIAPLSLPNPRMVEFLQREAEMDETRKKVSDAIFSTRRSATSSPRRAVTGSREQRSVRAIAADIYRNGYENIPSKQLVKDVTDEQKRRGQLISKRDLILRALGRRKK
jgi:hypothetical protein